MSTGEKVKLKWFRLIQIVILPVMILYGIYMLISYFTDLFGFSLSWTDHSLRELIEFGGADIFHLGAFFWPVIGLLAQRILMLVLSVYAWIGSFRFRKYSARCWLAITVLGLLSTCVIIWAIWEFGLNRGGIIQMAQYISAQTGRTITVSSSMVTALRIMLIIMGVIALLYTIANFIYFRKRRHLFTDSEDYQEPYEDEEYEPVAVIEKTDSAKPQPQPETPVIDSVEPVIEPVIEPAVSSEPEPAAEPEAAAEAEPEPVVEPVQTPEPEPAVINEPSVNEEADNTTEAPEGNDELDQLLKDTEDSMNQIGKTAEQTSDEQPGEAVEIIPDVPEEEPEEETPFTRSNPLAYDEEEEDPSLAATQILEPVDETQVKKEEINFCPDCGKRIPDPEMRFCIYCGRKIR